MILKNWNWNFQNCLPLNFCDHVIKFAKEQQFIRGMIGNKKDKGFDEEDLNVRKSEIVWLNEPWINRHLHPFVHHANRNAGWNFQYTGHENIQFTKYVDDGHYDWHADMDVEPPNHGIVRKIVIKEARKKGSVIVFPSFLLHKVTPVTSGTRYSLVMWTLGQPFN